MSHAYTCNITIFQLLDSKDSNIYFHHILNSVAQQYEDDLPRFSEVFKNSLLMHSTGV